jgi:hypothetical protein
MTVATTGVVVGGDVPEATFVVIEHAERFGLAQLYQPRGTAASSCLRSIPAIRNCGGNLLIECKRPAADKSFDCHRHSALA